MIETQEKIEVIPYIHLAGTTDEALKFYARALQATAGHITRYADMPSDGSLTPADAKKVANVLLTLPGGSKLYLSDAPSFIPHTGIEGISVALNFTDIEVARRVFTALSEGGEVGMPMQETMWAQLFGMVKDKFGVDWLINGTLKW